MSSNDVHELDKKVSGGKFKAEAVIADELERQYGSVLLLIRAECETVVVQAFRKVGADIRERYGSKLRLSDLAAAACLEHRPSADTVQVICAEAKAQVVSLMAQKLESELRKSVQHLFQEGSTDGR